MTNVRTALVWSFINDIRTLWRPFDEIMEMLNILLIIHIAHICIVYTRIYYATMIWRTLPKKNGINVTDFNGFDLYSVMPTSKIQTHTQKLKQTAK